MGAAPFTPTLAWNAPAEGYWSNVMGEAAAKEFSYMWHQHLRLSTMARALNVWLRASDEDRHVVAKRLMSFNGMMLDALWTTLLLGLCAFGDRRGKLGEEPIGIPAWLSRHREALPRGSRAALNLVREELSAALEPIKSLRNGQLAHWDPEVIQGERLHVHIDEVTAALGQVEFSFRVIEGCFAKDHYLHLPIFDMVGGMRHYIEAVKAFERNLEDMV